MSEAHEAQGGRVTQAASPRRAEQPLGTRAACVAEPCGCIQSFKGHPSPRKPLAEQLPTLCAPSGGLRTRAASSAAPASCQPRHRSEQPGPRARRCAERGARRYARRLPLPRRRPRFLGAGSPCSAGQPRNSQPAASHTFMARLQPRRAAWAAALLLAVLLQAVGPASAATASRRANCGGGRRLRQAGHTTPSPGARPALQGAAASRACPGC